MMSYRDVLVPKTIPKHHTSKRKIQLMVHRVISWWLVIFSVTTILTGYAAAREWGKYIILWNKLHLISEWSFLVLIVYHTIYTFFKVKLKTGHLLKHFTKNWIRLTQILTKWLILVFTISVVATGLSYYSWFNWPAFVSLFAFSRHVQWDVYQTISIIVHVMCGVKVMLIRKRKNTWLPNVLSLLIGISLILIVLDLEFFGFFFS